MRSRKWYYALHNLIILTVESLFSEIKNHLLKTPLVTGASFLAHEFNP